MACFFIYLIPLSLSLSLFPMESVYTYERMKYFQQKTGRSLYEWPWTGLPNCYIPDPKQEYSHLLIIFLEATIQQEEEKAALFEQITGLLDQKKIYLGGNPDSWIAWTVHDIAPEHNRLVFVTDVGSSLRDKTVAKHTRQYLQAKGVNRCSSYVERNPQRKNGGYLMC